MAIVKPFVCIRPKQAAVKEAAALPYDVYDRKEAGREVARHPLSFLAIDRPDTAFPDSVGSYEPCVYEKAREIIKDRISRGIYFEDREASFYVYEQTMEGRVQTGIAACASVKEYLDGTVKKHENTREEKELDRIRHIDKLDAQTGPIFLAYRPVERLKELETAVKEGAPLYDFVSEDGIGHRIWKVEGDLNRELEEEFLKVPAVYIADGHHRAASAAKVALKRRERFSEAGQDAPFEFFLSVLFPADELRILPYNRVVRDLAGHSVEEFLKEVSESFFVRATGTEPVSPEEKGQFGMFLDGLWYELRIRPEFMLKDPVGALDVSVLQERILGPVLGITDPRTDDRIDFVGGIRGLKELERRAGSDMRAAFSMYPTSMEELLAVADAGLLMPPKSTWFEPKLRSGIFVHRIG